MMSDRHAEVILATGGLALVILQAAKLGSVLLAIRWILGRGQSFVMSLSKRAQNLSPDAYWELLDAAGAQAVWPFGVLEYRLLRWTAGRKHPASRAILRLGRFVFYDFTSLGAGSVALLYLASAPMFSKYVDDRVIFLAGSSAILTVVQLLALYAEACVSYAKLGSYGLAFHNGSRYVAVRRSPGTYVTEIKTLAGAVIYSLGTGTFIMYFASRHGGDFAALRVSGTTAGGTVNDLLNCAYFSLGTFFTADSAGPLNGPARAASAALILQAACAVILALSTFTLFVKADPELEHHSTPGEEGGSAANSAEQVDASAPGELGKDERQYPDTDISGPPRGDRSAQLAKWALFGAAIATIAASVAWARTTRSRRRRLQ